MYLSKHHASMVQMCAVECDDGDVKLLQESEEVTSGQVELCVKRRWATMCIDNGDSSSASVG